MDCRPWGLRAGSFRGGLARPSSLLSAPKITLKILEHLCGLRVEGLWSGVSAFFIPPFEAPDLPVQSVRFVHPKS